jgi:hypothetical protein
VGKLVSAGDAENPKDWLVILNVFILPLFNNVAISPLWKPGTSDCGGSVRPAKAPVPVHAAMASHQQLMAIACNVCGGSSPELDPVTTWRSPNNKAESREAKKIAKETKKAVDDRLKRAKADEKLRASQAKLAKAEQKKNNKLRTTVPLFGRAPPPSTPAQLPAQTPAPSADLSSSSSSSSFSASSAS